MRGRLVSIALWGVLLGLARVCVAQELPLVPVTLQLKWTHAFQFAGYYMAKEKGYYREAGLDVEIRAGGPNIDVVGQVLSGAADFGVATSDLLLAYAEGQPVKVLGVVYQHSPVILIMRGDKPSSTMQDLVGKTIMIEQHAADLFAMFNRAGVPLDELNCLDHTGHIEDLLTSEAQAIFAYLGNEPFVLDQMGVNYFILSPRTYGIDFYGDNFFTTDSLIEQDEALVKGFCTATARGWQDALTHSEAAVDLILAEYPTQMSREHLLYEARVTKDLMTQLVTPGYMLPGRWAHIAETYMEVGMLDEIPDLDGFVFDVHSEGQETEMTIPVWVWQAFFLTISLMAFFVIVAVHFRNLSCGLRREIAKREESEVRLVATNQALTLAKETAEEANLKKTWFIANVSHDLRAPISSMIGLSNIFKHHSESLKLPEKFKVFLDQLHSGGEFLMLMLNNILDLSAFEMDAAVVWPEVVELDEWSAGMMNLVYALAEAKGVRLELDVASPFYYPQVWAMATALTVP